MLERLQRALPKAKFFPGARRKQIATAEELLSVTLPDWLRELYLQCNGIDSGTGYRYLLPIEKRRDLEPLPPELEMIMGKYPAQGHLICENRFLRDLQD